MTAVSDGAYYDPYDFEVDTDPYPIWRRLRDELPLYYNEKYDFYALSRFNDVERGLRDWDTYRSAKGTVLELIKANLDRDEPVGVLIGEDPPLHDVHRGILSRVFTPKKMLAIEPMVRSYCARTLDPLMGSDGFDFVADFASPLPMRVIGMLLGIPEEDQQGIRDIIDARLQLEEEAPTLQLGDALARSREMFDAYITWRMDHPSDDLMTELLTVEFEDDRGVVRRLTRKEVLLYVGLLAAAGNETTTRLISWTGKVLSDHPDQMREVAEDRSLVPRVIEEVLRFESPSPVQGRYVMKAVRHYGQTVPAGSCVLLLNGSANRDERQFEHGENFDIHRPIGHHLAFGYGLHFCLGAALARLEGRVALEEVLARWAHWQVDPDKAVQAHTSTVRGWVNLPVVTIG